jgi:hypothetical protein
METAPPKAAPSTLTHPRRIIIAVPHGIYAHQPSPRLVAPKPTATNESDTSGCELRIISGESVKTFPILLCDPPILLCDRFLSNLTLFGLVSQSSLRLVGTNNHGMLPNRSSTFPPKTHVFVVCPLPRVVRLFLPS